MACQKCGYRDEKEVLKNSFSLCRVCATFSPNTEEKLGEYVAEKLDWKTLDTFRKFGQSPGKNQKAGMSKTASKGKIVTRAPWGYDIKDGELKPNEDSAKVHSLFRTFLNRTYSLNSLAKNFSLSVNGVKKILKNRTYLGEVKFDGKLHKGHHKPLISTEIFYAVQRKLENYLRPRNKSFQNKNSMSK